MPPADTVDRCGRQILQRRADPPCLQAKPVEDRPGHGAPGSIGKLIEMTTGPYPGKGTIEDRHHLARRHGQQRQAADHGAGLLRDRQPSVAKMGGIEIEHAGLRKSLLQKAGELRAIFDQDQIGGERPRSRSALVKTPVPGPSSMTGAFARTISFVIKRARDWLEGAIAATRNGSDAQVRKKCQRSDGVHIWVKGRSSFSVGNPAASLQSIVYSCILRKN